MSKSISLDDSARALSILEQGKTRLLTETLRLHVPRPAGVPDAVWTTFEQAGEAIRSVQASDENPLGQVPSPVQVYAAHEQAARSASAALDAAITQVQTYVPDFLKAIDLPDMRALLPNTCTALIAFCITDQGNMGRAEQKRASGTASH